MDLKAPSLKDELDSDMIDKLVEYIRPLRNSATNRKSISKDNYQFYFNKALTSKGIMIQNDVLTEENFLQMA